MTVFDKLTNLIKNNIELNIKFEKIAEEWLKYKKNMVKESTYCNYENARNTIKTSFLLGLAKYYRKDDEDFSIDSLFGRIKKKN